MHVKQQMVIVFLLRSTEKSHSFQDLLKCRCVLFCFQIIALHVSAACLEYTGGETTFSQELCVENVYKVQKNCRIELTYLSF